VIKSVLLAQTGPAPWWAGFLDGIGYGAVAKNRVVVVTDRAVILLEAGKRAPAKPKELLQRLPRNVRASARIKARSGTRYRSAASAIGCTAVFVAT